MRDFTDITIVLDRSGSMSNLVKDVIGGYKSFVEKQKAAGDNACMTLVQFDYEYQTVFAGVPITNVAPDLKFEPRGSTALLDAMGKTINSTGKRLRDMPRAERPDKVIFVVITDGEENASTEFKIEKIREMVERQQNEYNWQFLFLGANIDSFSVAQSYGINAWTTSNYAASGVGIRSALGGAATYTCSLRSTGESQASLSQAYAEEIANNANSEVLGLSSTTGTTGSA